MLMNTHKKQSYIQLHSFKLIPRIIFSFKCWVNYVYPVFTVLKFQASKTDKTIWEKYTNPLDTCIL